MVSEIVSKRELIQKAPEASDDYLLKNVTKLFRYCAQQINIVRRLKKNTMFIKKFNLLNYWLSSFKLGPLNGEILKLNL